MPRLRTILGVVLAGIPGLLAAPSARAASLQPVSNWGATGVPTDVSMYIYVPDRVAATPPILVLVHYCGGTAPNVFAQAQGGGIVRAADQYGFIMVVPSSGRCWDVVSNRTRTRNGGGDSHAIRQMVTYALDTHQANANRVYATGDSSGGMMTELLLALYPDVFKAGAAFAGMPAGCRGANESGNGGGYSGACAGGSVTHTPQEWGDIARMMHPGYTGHRPRVQLFHGDDDMLIDYANHTEAIKQWTNVLGVSTSPTSTDMGVTLGTHRSTRQKWQNSCGFVVLDAFQSIGGDHGPSDALFPAQYVIPFLGLDKTGLVDPEIAQCASGGTGGSGGAGGTGGADGGVSGSAGSSGAGNGGNGGTGPAGAAGSIGSAGSAGVGGATGSGGSQGSSGSAGANGSGSGGALGSGGAVGVGGSAMTGGSAGNGAGASTPSGADSEPSGCACELVKAKSNRHGDTAVLALGLSLVTFARRRRMRALGQR
jgi:acetylxylan esterase